YIGGEVTCHQDSTYLFQVEQPITGLWFALEDATLENGCLWAIPGGHHTALKSRMIRDHEDKIRTEIYDATPFAPDRMIPLEVSRGSLIVLHGLLPHMSYANTSSRSRQAYTLHIGSELCTYPENNWLQRSSDLPFRGFLC
ncbi:MAG: phytanoyl-CoA dioxygenase family protein, partial [Rickettsiales bacterium]